MNNSLVFGKDSSNVSRAAKCTTDGKFIMDIDKSNDVATETTLRQVKTAIENIDVNVGDITLGEITVASNDTETHEKLDINNGLIISTNAKLDTLNATLSNKHLNKLTDSVDISGQTITVANLSTVAKESTLSNINQNIPQMESDAGNRLLINTEGQSISVGNNVLINGTVNVSSGSILVSNFPSNQQVFGSVNVSNMITDYATNTNLTAVKSSIDNKHLNSGTDSVSVVGAVTVSNFPSNQTIQGTVGVSNLFTLDATTQLTNTKLDTINSTITNKHLNKSTDSVDISGQSVSVNTISGFALETGGNLADIKNNSDKLKYVGDDLKAVISNTGFNCNNIASTPLITGFALDSSITTGNAKLDTINATITNKHLNKTTDSVDISGQSVSVNTISGFALESGGNLADIKNNSDKLKYVGDDLKAVISNTGFNCNNIASTPLITGFALDSSITTGNAKLDTINATITNKHLNKSTDSVDISGQAISVNTISGFALETTLNGVKTQADKLKFVDDDLKTTVSNQITGFATETTLNGVKTQADKLKFAGDDLKSIISNTSFDAKLKDGNNNTITSTVYGIDGVRGLDVSIKNATQAEPLIVEIPITSVVKTSIDNLPTNYDITVGGGTTLSAVASSLYTNLRDTTGSAVGVDGNPLFVAVSNAGTNSLDVNITGGTITGANGKAYLYSGDEASSISATTVGGKVGIDSNIINTSLDVHCYGSSNGTTFHHLKTDGNGILNTHAMLQSGAGTDLTSTLVGGTKQSLDTYVANTVDTSSLISGNFGSTKTALTCDSLGYLNTNSNITGGTINIKSTGGNTLGSDVMSQSLNVNVAAINNDGSALTNKLSYTNKSTNKRALDCEISNSYLTTRLSDTNGVGIGAYGSALNVNVVNNATPITTYNADTAGINTKIPSGLSTTTNTITGLNVYPILPLGQTYTMSGVGGTGAYIVFAGSALSTLTITSQSWGLANPKSWYAKCSVARTLNYEYIDDTGATGTGTISLSAGVYSGVLPLQGGGSGTNKIVGINRWWTTVNLSIGDTVLISATSASDANAIAGGGPTYSNIGVFTCPAGCRAFISSVNVGLGQGVNAAADTVRLFHFTTGGIRTVRHVLANVYTAQSYNINSGNAYGSIGGWLEPGEAFMWAGQSGTTEITQRNISCQIMCINY